MKIVFRVDASLAISTGHVMRCLTLADGLKKNGAECQFICREHEGNLISHIRDKGYLVYVLPLPKTNHEGSYSEWLGSSQKQDAFECASILNNWKVDWLVVDHYAIDRDWEVSLSPHYQKLMVIDDLANRPHQCDLLLDQTFGRNETTYKTLTNSECTILSGSRYALLRPEFAANRQASLLRRKTTTLKHILVSMGGIDKNNTTSDVLKALVSCSLPDNSHITVVLGKKCPWIDQIKKRSKNMPWPTSVLINVENMAQLMLNSDLAIGAAGSTSWERCCLGLPSIMLILADNQLSIAKNLTAAGAAETLSHSQLEELLPQVLKKFIEHPPALSRMSNSASTIVDGEGTSSVIKQLTRT